MTDLFFITGFGLFILADTVIVLFIITVVFRKILTSLVSSSCLPVLAQEWPCPVEPGGIRFPRQYLRLGPVWFKNAATLVITDHGLYIAPSMPLLGKVGDSTHIPWSHLQFDRRERFFLSTVYTYQVMIPDPVELSVMPLVMNSFPDHLKPVE